MKKYEINDGYYIIDLSQIRMPGTTWDGITNKDRYLSIGQVYYYDGGYRFYYFYSKMHHLVDDLDITDNFFLKKLDLENALH